MCRALLAALAWCALAGAFHPDFEFLGNPYCFKKGFSYHNCCSGPPPGDTGCWDGSDYTYEKCCMSGSIIWIEHGVPGHALAYVSQTAKPSDEECPSKRGDECKAGAAALRRFSRWRLAEAFPRVDTAGCARAGGITYNVSVQYTPYRAYAHGVKLDAQVCAPEACSHADVAAVVAPTDFLGWVQKSGIFGNFWMEAMRAVAGGVKPKPASGVLGARMSPASAAEVAAYRRMFWVCGNCRLARYGGRYDGGYIMCAVGGENQSYAGLYSYGIQGEDRWGEEMSATLGAVVHRYDCVGSPIGRCEPPCKAVPHQECLAQKAVPGLDGTLPQHLAANGHADAEEGSLLLKIDIEGEEWGVFAALEPRLLRKFRQIVVELHNPFLDGWMTDVGLQKRVAAMRNLLQSFVITHVHLNNSCKQPDHWSCIEVTFANRAFFKTGSCRKPSHGPLDDPNRKDHADHDISELF